MSEYVGMTIEQIYELICELCMQMDIIDERLATIDPATVEWANYMHERRAIEHEREVLDGIVEKTAERFMLEREIESINRRLGEDTDPEYMASLHVQKREACLAYDKVYYA